MKGLFVAVCLVAGLAGPIDRLASGAGILGGLILWAWSAVGSSSPAGSRALLTRTLSWAPLLAGLPLLLRMHDVEARLALIACLLLATCTRQGVTGAAFTASVLGWRLLVQDVPWLWLMEVEGSRLVSRSLGLVTGQTIDLGPSASGVELLIVFSLWLAAAGKPGGASWTRRILAAAALVCLFMLFMAALPALGRMAPGLSASPQSVARVMFGSSAALMALLCVLLPAAASPRPAPRGGRTAALLLLLILTACLAVLHAPRPDRRQGEIVLAGRGAFDMNVPVPGRHGAAQAGMFGLLPRYLGMDGHHVLRHDGPIDHEALSRAAVVIVALPTAALLKEEQGALDAYVRGGGSLVVMGDHTDLLGTMGPINDLIGRWRIELRFDSAYPSVREWAECLDGDRPGLRAATGIGTGASLWIGAGARALIIGRYGLSDRGDRANGGAGGYLGNYAYDPGERLGDIVLAAQAQVGQGRVVVFGDTSSFQNLMLPASYAFVAWLFDDLARPLSFPARVVGAAGLAAALAAAGLAAVALRGSSTASAGLALAVLGSAAWGTLAAAPGPLERLPRNARVALLDASHLNRYERELWHEDSIGGLMVSLERLGFLPLVVDKALDLRVPGVEALPVLIAPRRALSAGETLALAAHVERGGDLLVSAGADEAHAVAPLLSIYGLSIGQLPLGPVPILADMDRPAWDAQRHFPQFRRANPVVSGGAAPARSLYSAFGHDIVVQARSRGGAGRLLVIGDPEFLTDQVLESEHDAWEGNLELLGNLLDRRRW